MVCHTGNRCFFIYQALFIVLVHTVLQIVTSSYDICARDYGHSHEPRRLVDAE